MFLIPRIMTYLDALIYKKVRNLIRHKLMKTLLLHAEHNKMQYKELKKPSVKKVFGHP